jgi:molecular chaperone HtpG
MSAASETPATETHRFQAEVSQVLNLVIHSLYTHKEVFLRELISNASDALDKLRFRALTEPDLLRDEPTLEIRVIPDQATGTLTVEDTGVGMTHDELVRNLGTIAHSGTRALLEQLQKQGTKDLQLIGQFGVGFYSAYLVADRVEVTSRAAGESAAWTWRSDAHDTFTVEPASRSTRGTSVVLHLKEEHREFLQPYRLRELIARYSDYVGHPIKLRTRSEGAGTFETVNRASALWQRPRSEVTREQYEEFYKHLTHADEPPLAYTHFKVEGTQEFAGLLFVPRSRPFDLDLPRGRRGVRLYVKRVLIMEDCEQLLPQWLRFVRGVVDSDDLPLNVSRETLQDSAVVRAIRKQLTKRTLDLLDEVARDRAEDYATFWRAFGAVLKEGLTVDWEYKDRLAELVRYESSRDGGLVSLAEYVSRMPEGQEAIYYVLGESARAVASSPHLEALRARGYEVLYMTDPVDEWAVQGLGEYKGKKLVSAMQADLKLGASAEEQQAREARAGQLGPLLEKVRAVLGERVREVRLSERLTDSPCCLALPQGAHHAYVERLLREHGREVSHTKRVFEINPSHPLIEHLRALHARDPESPRLADWIELLYDQALLTEGSRLEDPNAFARRMTTLLTETAAGVPQA